MVHDSGDQSGGVSSFVHKFSPEPLRLQQLHVALNHGDQTTPSSSARQSTDIIENEVDVLEVRKRTERTAAILNEKNQDSSLIGFNGIISPSPDTAMQVDPTEYSSQIPTTLRISEIAQEQ